jgi:hypothetical protein
MGVSVGEKRFRIRRPPPVKKPVFGGVRDAPVRRKRRAKKRKSASRPLADSYKMMCF